jgi:hypothetical protein
MTTPNDPVRQAFEAHIRRTWKVPESYLDWALKLNEAGEYQDGRAADQWSGWSAALSTFPQAAAAVPLIAEIADAIERNDIISGSPGPLYSVGWSDANKHAACFIRERFGITPPEGASE